MVTAHDLPPQRNNKARASYLGSLCLWSFLGGGGAVSELKIRTGDGPICPKCDNDAFDDWWVGNKTLKRGGPVIELTGSIKCHGCGRFFKITKYQDGPKRFHSEMKAAQ